MKSGISVVKTVAAVAAAGIALTLAAGEVSAKSRYCRKEYCAKYEIKCSASFGCRPTKCLLKGAKIVKC